MTTDEMIQTPYGKKRWSFLKQVLDSHDELLAACEAYVTIYGHRKDHDGSHAMQLARAAIAKAKGGAA